MSEQKPKKPFLKRGTRQFLSNAQVRSLNQKPRIVQFNDQQFENTSSPFVNPNQPKTHSKQDIVIAVKPKNIPRDKSSSALNKTKQQTKKITNNLAQKNKPNHNQTHFDEQPVSAAKPSTSLSKGSAKKPTLLADYLNNDSKPAAKKPVQPPVPSQMPKNTSAKTYQPVVQTQAHHLKMQDIDDDSDDQKVVSHKNIKPYLHEDDQDNEFIAKRPKNSESSPEEVKRVEPPKRKPNLLQEVTKKQKENLNMQNQRSEQKQEENDVNFNSDSDEDDKRKKNQFKTSKTNKNLHQNRFNDNQNEEEERSDDENEVNRKATVKLGTKPQSKVAQMFNKNGNQKSQPVAQPEPVKQKMTVKDIPQELIEELVNMYFSDAKQKYQKKQQNLFQQVKIVQKKQQALNEQEKNLQKRVKQHEKMLQERTKEFETKIKSEQGKITRQKMYLKDQQTAGKVDWKTKNQVQELKQQLEEQRNEKKRIEVKLKGELDRLKTRFMEEMEIKKNLESRIKDYELKEIKEKQVQMAEQKQQKQQKIRARKAIWQQAPRNSYLQRFIATDFSLSEFTMENYFYTKNQFYQYYDTAGDQGALQMEENQKDKIRRTYDSGKVEIESPGKYLKEIFPWGYIIVHYSNGDVKQAIQFPAQSNTAQPKQMEIYFAKSNGIIEYSIPEGKKIHYFLNNDQVEFTNEYTEFKEVLMNGQLQRTEAGKTKMYKKNAKGNFIEIY